MDKTIFIVRHGETDLNKQGIVQGSGVDASLNDFGRRQAKAFFDFYQKEAFETVITSTLVRTHQTMEPFIETGLPWMQIPEINEISWGSHEGKSSTPEMRKEYRRMVDSWKKGDFSANLGGGESAQDLADRLQVFIDHLLQRPEQKLLVCSHGRAMRCLMCLLAGRPLQHMEQFHHHNTGLYKVHQAAGAFSLELYNDIRHLEGLES